MHPECYTDACLYPERAGQAPLEILGVPIMRLFMSLAEQSFMTDAAHRRLFYRWGMGWRPYIISDTETEIRIKQKLVWCIRLSWVACVLYLAALPNISDVLIPVTLGILFIVLGLLFYFPTAADLKHLARVPDKVNYQPEPSYPSFSFIFLWLCAGNVLAGVWRFATGKDVYFLLFNGVAEGAIVLGIFLCIFLWRRLRSPAAAKP